MACEAVQPLSGFYGTNLQSRIDGYSRLVDRISWTLGYPLVNLEIHQNQLFEFITIAAEMFTKYAGYTEEYLIFNSNLYEQGKGIRLDKLFTLTPELKNAYTSVDVTLSDSNPRSKTTTVQAGLSAVVYDYDISDTDIDPTEFGLRLTSSTDNHQRVSKLLVTTQFDKTKLTTDAGYPTRGAASFTEFGTIYTSSSDLATFSVVTSGASGQRVAITVTPVISGEVVVVATDVFASSLSSLESQQSGFRSYDTLINNYRKVMEVVNFEEGSNQGTNTLFTIEQTLAQQTYFSYAMGNYGFDLISWYTVKEFLETREKMLSLRRAYKFDERTQYLTMYPGPLSGEAIFYGVVYCYLERPLSEVIKEQWVYQYALAMTKIAIGNVRGKFGGTTLLGGGTINSESFMNQGIEEKKALEETLYSGASPGFGDADPPMFFIG